MEATAERTVSSWRPALLVGALSVAIGLITLGSKSLWFDETYDDVHVRESWHTVARLIRGTEMSQSAYMVALKLWTTVTPSSEFWLRFPSVLLAASAAALLVPLGARLFDRTTGVVAGLLLATNEQLVRHAQEARTYALVTFAVVVATWLFVRALDDPTLRNWLHDGTAAAVAVYCHFYAGFVVVAHLASLPLAPARPPLRRVVEAGAAFVVVAFPALYFTATAGRNQLGWIRPVSTRRVVDTLESTSGHNAALAAAAAFGLLVLAYRAGGGRADDRWRLALVGGWCALPFALGALVSIVQPIFVGRYLVVVTPAIALAGAVAVAAVAERRRAAAVGALVVLLAVASYRVVEWYGRTTEDWRGAAAFVAREYRPGDGIEVAPRWATTAYVSYDAARYRAAHAGGARDRARRTFVLLYPGPNDDPGGLASGVVDRSTLSLTSEQTFGGKVIVQVYEPQR